jgi:chemotaxis protein methyltransferase CheR
VGDQLALAEPQRADYEVFKQRVYRKTGIDLNLYKAQQMHRRLMGLVERARLTTFSEYAQLIDRDPAELAVFLDRMTINVSELFRNPEKWDELRDRILQSLLKPGRPLRVWSAGCSYGAEPFTLAMLLDHLSPCVRHFLLATDIDRVILEKARHGIFTSADIKNVPRDYRRRYLAAHGEAWQIVPSLRERVTFRAHNLLSDPFESDFDLIVCRNVIIYFTEEAKNLMLARFANSLKPGGMLFLGGTERIFNHREIGLESRIPFFYQRIEGDGGRTWPDAS